MPWQHVRVSRFGGPEVLELAEEQTIPDPGPGEVRIKVLAAGTGFTDTFIRRGRYLDFKGPLPFTPGYELVGVVEQTGPGVTEPRNGQLAEAAALILVGNAGLDAYQKITTLGKLLLFDKTLSVNRNEACVFCHMPEAGWTGPSLGVERDNFRLSGVGAHAVPATKATSLRLCHPGAHPLFRPEQAGPGRWQFLGHARLGNSPWQPGGGASGRTAC